MRPAILTFVRYYLPGYKSGGPVRTIANLVRQLGDELQFRIVTGDRDAFDGRPYRGVLIDQWNVVGNAKVFYASSKSQSFRRIARLMRRTPHDILYLNSFFDPVFSMLPMLARAVGLAPWRPTVLAPRGEFSGGALGLKTWKKWPYIQMAKTVGLYRDVVWQASSELDAADIQRAMGNVSERIRVVPNLVARPSVRCGNTVAPRDSTELKIVFLSRITPMKNLDFALRVLARVTVPIRFSIYGVIDDAAYWRRCQDIIARLPAHISVCYRGPIPHEDVLRALADHHLFFLPTLGENFGHVIIEALMAGLPVLLSDRTPWRGLDGLGVGWDFPLNEPEMFVAAIEGYARASVQEHLMRRARARSHAVALANDPHTIALNRLLFTDLVDEMRPGAGAAMGDRLE